MRFNYTEMHLSLIQVPIPILLIALGKKYTFENFHTNAQPVLLETLKY